MSNILDETVSTLQSVLPPVFAGLALDELTSGPST